MSTNHLPLEPAPAWSWQLPMEQQLHHAGRFLPQQHYYYQHHHRPQVLPAQAGDGCEREHLFEKPLTPSDVGKLNRLVIPKQHAERYFPLDGDSGEKGLLLSFEDEAGKAWRFRYSYWTSSQSYVLTKGWSRFVKEKRLDAGDVVLFERRRSCGDRLYIGWKRRGAQESASVQTANAAAAAQFNPSSYYPAPAAAAPTPYHPYPYTSGVEPQDCVHNSGEQGSGPVQNTTSAPPATGTNSKRLRLFGVNLDCGPEQEPEPHQQSGGGSGRGQCMEAGDHGRSHHVQFTPPGGAFYQLSPDFPPDMVAEEAVKKVVSASAQERERDLGRIPSPPSFSHVHPRFLSTSTTPPCPP
ncbi:hypothetical protein Taro_010083 [Colocasia esculenta]|uniref:TF-B3 domain-containing protein n=1 Tax=Colocasia esculenta TaxID=4460 RepID=A0A843U2P3_COLES|nr:hypothetical protein [Colocasia esculenta]